MISVATYVLYAGGIKKRKKKKDLKRPPALQARPNAAGREKERADTMSFALVRRPRATIDTVIDNDGFAL